jgi:hypothetical protein
VVTNAELLRRRNRSKYSIALDADWKSEVTQGDESLLSIDSTVFTNVARWLNHRYDSDPLQQQSLHTWKHHCPASVPRTPGFSVRHLCPRYCMVIEDVGTQISWTCQSGLIRAFRRYTMQVPIPCLPNTAPFCKPCFLS